MKVILQYTGRSLGQGFKGFSKQGVTHELLKTCRERDLLRNVKFEVLKLPFNYVCIHIHSHLAYILSLALSELRENAPWHWWSLMLEKCLIQKLSKVNKQITEFRKMITPWV
jgi:hypothetical protein